MADELDDRDSDHTHPREQVTITIDRDKAEDLYYALLLALGGRDYSESQYGKSGKNGGKSYAAS